MDARPQPFVPFDFSVFRALSALEQSGALSIRAISFETTSHKASDFRHRAACRKKEVLGMCNELARCEDLGNQRRNLQPEEESADGA